MSISRRAFLGGFVGTVAAASLPASPAQCATRALTAEWTVPLAELSAEAELARILAEEIQKEMNLELVRLYCPPIMKARSCGKTTTGPYEA